MGKKLIITEKPSVARDITQVLGKAKKNENYYEVGEFLVTWAVGHLVNLADPEYYDKKLRRWSLDLLPIIPDHFKLKAIGSSIKRLNAIKKLMASNEVEAIINACDAGREGELIFRYIYAYNKCSKPIFRLWLSSMTKVAIQQALENILSGDKFEFLADAARCRSEGDWLIGINGTRAFTARYRLLLSVGRVQTPTLAILVNREREIQNFKPVPYWEIFAQFNSAKGGYLGKWRNKEDRTYDRQEAEKVLEKVKDQKGEIASFSQSKVKEPHPLLYDLTELQREANRRFGFSAQRTLNIAQRLYENRKLITYPRTDSRYLSEDLMEQIQKSWEMLKECDFGQFVSSEIKLQSALRDRRIFDRTKVTDHHAIIPTGEEIRWDSLRDDERKIMDLVVRRFICVFYPEAVWAHRQIKTQVAGENFLSKSKVLLQAGWRELYLKEQEEKEEPEKGQPLPLVKKGDQVEVERVWLEEKETKAPPRYTEATLLSAMEGAGRFVEKEELREALKEAGIGTPATRAAIMERLIEVGYLERNQKALVPTPKGMELISLVENIPIDELASPQLTGKWEKKLKMIEKGEYPREKFMEEIKQLTREMVDKIKNKEEDGVREKMEAPVGECPLCGAPVLENRRSFSCSRWKEGCTFSIWKTILGRRIPRAQVQKLLTQKKSDKIAGFNSKKGKKFSAYLVLEDDGNIKFQFDQFKKKSSKNVVS